MDKVLEEVGYDQLILETDCPYLAPVPHRGKRNEPAYISLVASKLAELTFRTYSEVVEETSANAKKLFSL